MHFSTFQYWIIISVIYLSKTMVSSLMKSYIVSVILFDNIIFVYFMTGYHVNTDIIATVGCMNTPGMNTQSIIHQV